MRKKATESTKLVRKKETVKNKSGVSGFSGEQERGIKESEKKTDMEIKILKKISGNEIS